MVRVQRMDQGLGLVLIPIYTMCIALRELNHDQTSYNIVS